MRTDVPLFYGLRMTGAVETPERMLETLLSTNPLLETAFELGVEVLLGTSAWGLYAPQPGLATRQASSSASPTRRARGSSASMNWLLPPAPVISCSAFPAGTSPA